LGLAARGRREEEEVEGRRNAWARRGRRTRRERRTRRAAFLIEPVCVVCFGEAGVRAAFLIGR